MNINESLKSIIQNLKDAGCDSEMIELFIEDMQNGKEASGLKRLAVHRKSLLDSLHREQKCIDCLDYLVYKINEENK